MKKFGLLAMLMLALSPLVSLSVSAANDTDVSSTTEATTSATTSDADDEELDKDDVDEEDVDEDDLENDEEIDAAVNDALNTTESEEPQLISANPADVKSVDTGIAGGAAAAALLLGGGALYAQSKRKREE